MKVTGFTAPALKLNKKTIKYQPLIIKYNVNF